MMAGASECAEFLSRRARAEHLGLTFGTMTNPADGTPGLPERKFPGIFHPGQLLAGFAR